MITSSEIALPHASSSIELAKRILCRLFRNFDGSIRICLWDGSEIHLGRNQPEFALIFRSAKALQDMALSHHPLRAVESYFQGLIDIDGDFYSALKLRYYLASLRLSLIEKAIFATRALMIKPGMAESNDSRPLSSAMLIGVQKHYQMSGSITGGCACRPGPG